MKFIINLALIYIVFSDKVRFESISKSLYICNLKFKVSHQEAFHDSNSNKAEFKQQKNLVKIISKEYKSIIEQNNQAESELFLRMLD